MIKAICTQFRNESNKISTWITYNIKEGFNTFILFDDHSSDDSEKIVKDIIDSYSDVRLIYLQTDNYNNSQLYENCLSTNEYREDSSLQRRISQSFLRGFETFKSLCNNEELNYCCFVDIDEILTTNSKNIITEVIENNLSKRDVEHLYVQSYDVNTVNLETDKNIFQNENTKYRWSNKNRLEFLNGVYSYRGKSIVTDKHNFICSSEDFWSIIHCGGCIGNNFETAIPLGSNKVPDESELRIHHYRVPPSSNSTIFDEYDDTAFNKFRTIRNKL